ncbi:response regulator [Myxococcus sp. K15C18031901]|uniref:hybrid sensor histidine kinase/response regulator n=1 Tax=Myxococcus dinghuensis TaxID=2906761 RepID=UPI0020A77E20|nr:response regulator [Myxococcus dinghuensis]MCP3104766.1 response regulator [Myxococcus dinghuensis]
MADRSPRPGARPRAAVGAPQAASLLPPPETAPEGAASTGAHVPGVLLVDDNPANLVSLEAILGPLGVRLTKAQSGEQALRFLLREDYAVILLDVRMAGMSGFETASLIKQRERTRNVPIIFLTAYGRDDTELVNGYSTGAVDFLQKPFPPEVLRSKVSVFVELFRAQHQVRQQAELLRQKEAEARELAQRAAGHIDRLRDFTARLSEAGTVEQVCRALFEQGLVAAGAKAGAVNLLDDAGEALEIVDAVGYPEAVLSRWRRIPLSNPVPLTEAVREQRPIWLGSLEEWSGRYPHLNAHGIHESAIALPLLVKGRALGAIGLSFARARPFTEMDRAFFSALAHACAQALERVRLVTEERRVHEELRRRSEFEQQLVGIVSHDLRNPLAAISMSVGLLEKKGDLSDGQRRAVQRIGQASERAARMIRDLLDFTKARLGGGIALHRQPTDLKDVVQQVLDEVQLAHPGRHVQVEVSEARGEWDPDRIAQVVSNLVANAVAYSPPDAPVRVRAFAEGPSAVLAVYNGGEPIPAQLMSRLFEPMTRGALREGQSTRSIGLGLYIVRDIIRGHGGRVDVVSSREDGTTFTVYLPRPREG